MKRTYTDYIVSEPYPNPFNPAQSTFTSISIKSSGNENLTIRIIDPLGQQVGYYNAITTLMMKTDLIGMEKMKMVCRWQVEFIIS